MIWYLLALALVAWAMFGVLLFARDAKVAPEVPPAEERPHLPEPARDALVEFQRQQRAIREEQLRIAYERRWEAKVQARIDALVREVEGV